MFLCTSLQKNEHLLRKILSNKRILLHKIVYYSDSQVRVRFAPSPTGFLHAGGLRTALYNYLYAKSHGGKFILRIEDTDSSRTIPGSIEAIENDLNWLSIAPDESPKCGGPFGPYIQSERIHIYQEHSEILLVKGFAYRCFCSTERLENLRRSFQSYDNKCRSLTAAEIRILIEENIPHCIRMKLPAEPTHFNDLIYGERELKLSEGEGDLIILRKNGMPTYHLANVVDDHLMEISHILRGSEWLSSLPKHVALYRAFEWKLPSYGHLPQVTNTDGTKLSKRQKDLHIQALREQGFPPAAILNFVRMAGAGFKDANASEIYYMPDLIQKFCVDLITKNSATLDMLKLEHFGQLDFQKVISSEEGLKQVTSELRQEILDKFKSSVDVDLSDSCLEKIIFWGQYRVSRLRDFTVPYRYLWMHPLQSIKEDLLDMKIINKKTILQNVIQYLKPVESSEFSAKTVGMVIKSVQKHHKLNAPTMMKLLRAATCGTTVGAPIAEVFSLIGKETCLRRLDRVESML